MESDNEEPDGLKSLHSAKRRGNLQWALALILIISIGAFVTNYLEYRLASDGLDFIRHAPHFADNKNQEEQAFGDFQVNRARAVRGMEQHSALALLALFGLWCIPRKDGRGLTKSDRPKDD
jgi:hypothetical protein